MSKQLSVSPNTTQPTSEDYLPLWINREWFIPVNKEGQCIGLCNEGALGFVVQLHSETNPQHHMALKLPRLMGETHRENAYISELMEKELNAVKNVVRGRGNVRGLIYADVAFDSPLRNPIPTEGGAAAAQEWDRSLIFVRYEKGQNPYFCLVKAENGNLKRYPAEAKLPITGQTIFEKLRQISHKRSAGRDRDWAQTVFVIHKSSSNQNKDVVEEQLQFATVNDALNESTVGTIWYTCLPSIMYGWADGTLQETISLGLRGKWSIEQHLTLISNVCHGLNTLHQRDMLHADVRPANIIYQGDPKDPSSYYLADYGSFAEVGARAADPYQDFTGGTVMGPVISGERTSAFYSSERRAGREREEADTAVILYPGDGSNLYILLGWRSELIDDTGKARQHLDQFSKEDYLSGLEFQKTLSKGDRLQIRDYIFDIEQEWSVRDKQILRCKMKFWKIYHGRIVVESHEEFENLSWFPIPRTVELLQWSASTDLYSLGVLALYSIYRNSDSRSVSGSYSNEANKDAITLVNQGQIASAKSNIKAEKDFLEMLTYLANPSYFNAIWSELEWLRKQLEDNLASDVKAAEFAQLSYQKHQQIDGNDEDVPKTLSEKTEKVVSRITQTIPGTEQLVAAFDYNLGPFVFFMHFVLRCLHRQNDVDSKMRIGADEHDWVSLPFCEQRNEPTNSGAAQRALQRLDEIRKIITDSKLQGIKSDAYTITGFDPRPDPVIRAQWLQFSTEVATLRTEVETLRHRRERYNQQTDKALTLLDEIRLWNLRKAHDLLGQIREALIEAFRSNSVEAVDGDKHNKENA